MLAPTSHHRVSVHFITRHRTGAVRLRQPIRCTGLGKSHNLGKTGHSWNDRLPSCRKRAFGGFHNLIERQIPANDSRRKIPRARRLSGHDHDCRAQRVKLCSRRSTTKNLRGSAIWIKRHVRASVPHRAGQQHAGLGSHTMTVTNRLDSSGKPEYSTCVFWHFLARYCPQPSRAESR